MMLEQFKTENLAVRFYLRDPSRVIVVFASAGAKRVDGYSEEYGQTLAPLNVSVIFVTDLFARWYNHQETETVFRRVAEMTKQFEHVGAMGESLGGSGALLFTCYAPHVSRVLAFTPQYSVAQPFIRFDARYLSESQKITQFYVGTFAESPVPEKCLLVYGNLSWRDQIHRAMFTAAGYRSVTVDDAPHEISRHLSKHPQGNNLAVLAAAFCDFAVPFNSATVQRIASVQWSVTELKEEHSFTSSMRDEVNFSKYMQNKIPLPAVAGRLISEGKWATQSSVSEYSQGRTAEEDARRALSGQITGEFSFHTKLEDNPWWKLDLGVPSDVSEIRLFNRISSEAIARRGYRFEILLSGDGLAWNIVCSKDNDAYFGGADGRPFICKLFPPVAARWVQVRLKGRNFLHLDQVQVFSPDAVLPVPASVATVPE